MKSLGGIRSPAFEILYFLIVLLLALLYTYPLVLDMNHLFYGFPWDSISGIWGFWWFDFAYTNDLPLHVYNYQAYPFGHDLSTAPFSYIYYAVGLISTRFTNELTAYNMIKLVNFPLLALTTYLLLNYLTGNRLVSSVVGLIYTFSPYHVIHLMAHFPNIYWMPLMVLFLLKLLREDGYRNAVLFGFFAGITFVEYAYYPYFIMLLSPVFLTAYLLDKNRRKDILSLSFLKKIFISLLIIAVVVLPQLLPMIKEVLSNHGNNLVASGIVRPISDLFIFSAKPLDYLLPSKHNLLLGWLVPDLGFGSLKGHRYTEHTLYLGYSMMLLAGYAVYRTVKKKGRLGTNKEERRTVYLFLAIAIVGVVLSAPPFIPIGDYHIDLQTREVIAGHKLYLPQYFLYKIFPMFRVYARMGVIVLLAVSVMAAFGLREVLARINSKRWKCLLLSLFLLIVFVEFAEFPSFRLTEVKEPAVYKWLALQPKKFPVVEYPLGAGDDPYTTYEYAFYQRIHKKYLVNGAKAGTPADDFRKEIVDISKQDTVEKLAGIGVRYVLIHKDKYLSGNETVPLDWITAVPRDKLFPVEYNNGKVPDMTLVKDRLRLVKSFKGTDVYEVVKGAR